MEEDKGKPGIAPRTVGIARRIVGMVLILLGVLMNPWVFPGFCRWKTAWPVLTAADLWLTTAALMTAGWFAVNPCTFFRVFRRMGEWRPMRRAWDILRSGAFWKLVWPVAAVAIAVQVTGLNSVSLAWWRPGALALMLEGGLRWALLIVSALALLQYLTHRAWVVYAVGLFWGALVATDWNFILNGGIRIQLNLFATCTGAPPVNNYFTPWLFLIIGISLYCAFNLVRRIVRTAEEDRRALACTSLALFAAIITVEPVRQATRIVIVPGVVVAHFCSGFRPEEGDPVKLGGELQEVLARVNLQYDEARRFMFDPTAALVSKVLTRMDSRIVAAYDPAFSGRLEGFANTAATPPPPLPARKPYRRVILVTMESMGASLVRSLNPAVPEGLTPTFDSLSRPVAHVSVSFPTTESLATHLCSHPNGSLVVVHNHPNALPRMLAEAGWRTALFEAPNRNFDLGERRFRELGYQELRDSETARAKPHLAPYVSEWGLCDRKVYEESVKWLSAHAGEKVFLHILTCDTHSPIGRLGYADLSYPDAPAWLAKPEFDEVRSYLTSVFRADHDLGRFLGGLEQAGLMDDETLVVVTGDHAPPPFPERKRVPMLASSPRFEAVPFWVISKQHPQPDANRLGSQCDTAPTIAHLLGMKPLPGWWGYSAYAKNHPRRLFGFRDDMTFVIEQDCTWRNATEEEREMGATLSTRDLPGSTQAIAVGAEDAESGTEG